jgi:hypothetical protein
MPSFMIVPTLSVGMHLRMLCVCAGLTQSVMGCVPTRTVGTINGTPEGVNAHP